MLTMWVVLSFPFIVGAGYAVLFALCRRNEDALTGPLGFVFYLVLLTIPTGFVLSFHSADVAAAVGMHSTTFLWLAPGGLIGFALWQVQQRGLPGRTADAGERIWCGAPGRLGFVLLLIPVAYMVVAEEIVWRVFLIPELGIVLAAGAFALHHFYFGLRHVLFSFIAGVVWGGCLLLSGDIWMSVVSHFVYNAMAWRQMRIQQVAHR